MKINAIKGTLKNPFFKRGKRMFRGARFSIQSLRVFVRHVRGGGGVPLPPLPLLRAARRIACFVLFLFVILNSPAVAQDQTAVTAKNEEKRLDLLFDRIMQTLPDRERNLVDSAAVTKNATHGAVDKARDRDGAGKPAAETETTRLRELPPELKEQVERAMADMKERNLERKAQFIEARRGKK
jgi:hypothetical protein